MKKEIKSVSSREMFALEQNAEYLGVSRLQLMENAGYQVSYAISSRFSPKKSVVIYSGVGGNGGDGFVVARHLTCQGFKVKIVLVDRIENIRKSNVQRNWRTIVSMKDSINVKVAYDSSLIPKIDADLILDAMLGTGARGCLRSPILQAVRTINDLTGFKIALDIPTGVDSDTGEVINEAVKADLTVTLHRVKHGLLNAKEYVGELIVADIGLPKEAETYAGPGDVYLVHKFRDPEAHKGDFGKVLIIGGDETFSGAPALAALAALRTGADLAYIAAPEKTAHNIASMAPELITIKLEGDVLSSRNITKIQKFIEKCDSVIIGPGLGLKKETIEAVKTIIEIVEKNKVPLLLDADGLNAFSSFRYKVNFPSVLTPHTGEYRTLTGENPPQELEEKVKHVKNTAKKLNTVILLKGNIDIVSDGTKIKLNRTGNPGMTVGGTGDVLSGIIGTFLAQGFDPFRSAVAGAFINGAAGDLIVQQKGYHIIPTDLISHIPKVIEESMALPT